MMENQKHDYFSLTAQSKSKMMDDVTKEWINKGLNIYKMVTFERLTKTKYILNNNFFFSYIHGEYIIDTVVHIGNTIKTKSNEKSKEIKHILTVYVIDKHTKKLVEETDKILAEFSERFFEVKDVVKHDYIEIDDEVINKVTMPLKNQIEQVLDTEVIVSMDRARTKLIKDNIYRWILVICDEDTIVPISVAVNMENLHIIDIDEASRHYFEERNDKYHTTSIRIMMAFHKLVDDYFMTHVNTASNIDKKLEVGLKRINCTFKYDSGNERKMLRFVYYFGHPNIKVYEDKVLVSEVDLMSVL
ncbi:hypothetical protein [Macrococcus sp. DPC7161]|uniref:hypothetical protein n=1 Tax=Macrococcus sp. DPC7161 TaxID=2507060 RepID=UPI00100C1B99|nr:hypothetical protein [Macrococcus sp. DPC7161]RXK17875.1 hypothetical protein ER639_06760 [Macrococcus sp. DPC7161]